MDKLNANFAVLNNDSLVEVEGGWIGTLCTIVGCVLTVVHAAGEISEAVGRSDGIKAKYSK